MSCEFDDSLTDTMRVFVVLTNDSALLNGVPAISLIEDVLIQCKGDDS